MKYVQITEEIARQMFESGVESLKQIAVLNFPDLFHQEKKWEDFGEVKGYYVYGGANIYIYKSLSNNVNRNTFPTEKEAYVYGVVIPQLLQWRDKANGEPLNDWCDLEDIMQEKYIINIQYSKINTSTMRYTYEPLAFKTAEIRDQFMKDHKSLLEEYASVAKFNKKK